MSEMVERVARELFKTEWANKGHSWEMEAAHHDYWRTAARAAISAMREPTEPMMACMLRFLSENLDYDEMYRRMIDVAISENR